MASADLLQGALMYVIVPLWLVAGFADYLCHRATALERTSGTKELLLHLAQFAQVGIGLLAALLLEVTSLVLVTMLVCVVLHEATAIWDVRYANAKREVPSVEQHIHGVLEALPFVALLVLTVVHWNDPADWSLRWKSPPLPAWYLASILAGAVALGALPYGEELARTLRVARLVTPSGAARPRYRLPRPAPRSARGKA